MTAVSEVVRQLAELSKLSVASDVAAQAAWEALFAAARMRWPSVKLTEAQLIPFVAERIYGEELGVALAAAPAADLALAAACTANEQTAIAAFEQVLVEVDAAGGATQASADQISEVKQMLRLQLLVAQNDKPPGIAGYRGRGPLGGWLRITATRELIRVKKKYLREQPVDRTLDLLLTSGIDPGFEMLKAEYRAEFAAALHEAVNDLTLEDRMVLRQQIVDDMSIDEIGAAFGVHRATAARWINRARASLVSCTHRRLADRLELPVEEVASVIRLVQSKLEASVTRFLRDS